MKTVLLLGATSDIGQALADKFAREDYELWLAGRNLTHLRDIATDVQIRHNVKTEIYKFEALDYDSHAEFYNSLPEIPDITICIFGYLGDQKKAQEEWAESLKILETNYIAAVSILNLVAESYVQAGKGTIVGISSVAGERGRQSNYFYGSAKAAFTSYLSGLRNRLYKKGVHVLTVKPGFVDTKMTEHLKLPPKLTASPEKVADAIFNGVKSKRNTIYVLGIWRLIMSVIGSIPEPVFKRLNL